MKKLLLAALAATSLIVTGLFVAPAWASGPYDWEGNGSENLPCESGAHWVLAPSKDVTSASVTVDGTTYPMTQSGNGSWSADSSGPVTENSVVTYTYTGDQDPEPHLQLSHCTDEPPPPPDDTPTCPEDSDKPGEEVPEGQTEEEFCFDDNTGPPPDDPGDESDRGDRGGPTPRSLPETL